MNILQINIYFGISILMKYNLIFHKLLANGQFDEIHVSLALDVLKKYRDTFSDTYTNNYHDIMKFIFIHPAIKVVQSNTFPNLTINDLLQTYSISMEYSILPQVKELSPVFPFNYVTLSTKVLNALSYSEYQMIKPMLFSTLSGLTIPLVILGEREVTPCYEYTLHTTYSIYNDIKEHLPVAIDRTIASTEATTELEPLLKSLSILHNSKLNIFMSSGGISVLTLFTSESRVGLTPDFKENPPRGIYTDTFSFLDALYTAVTTVNNS